MDDRLGSLLEELFQALLRQGAAFVVPASCFVFDQLLGWLLVDE